MGILVFCLSLLIGGIIAYIVFRVWFVDRRNNQLKSFGIFGVAVCLWTIINGITIVVNQEYFEFIYNLRMIFVCIVPYTVFWFALNYSGSKLTKSKLIKILIIALPLLDITALLTNPLHGLFFTSFDYPKPTYGVLFYIHVIINVIFILYAFGELLRHVLKSKKTRFVLVVSTFGTIVPYILNVIYTFELFGLHYDLTPLGFFILFLPFLLTSYRSRVLSFRSTTMEHVFYSIDDIIIVTNEDGKILNTNNMEHEVFPDFNVILESTTFDDFLEYLKCRGAESARHDIIDASSVLVVGYEGSELSIPTGSAESDKHFYTITSKEILLSNVIAGYVVTMTDVTSYKLMIGEIHQKNKELIRLTNEAEDAAEAKGQFLSNMSHEIRTPLNAVIGMTEIAKKTADGKTLQSLEEITKASDHLLGVLNDVLDMSKIESGKFLLASEPFNLYESMKEVVEIIEQKCLQKSIKLEANIESEKMQFVIGDKLRLKQVLINLLGNAIKFTDNEGTITLSGNTVSETDEKIEVSFSVRDTGIGMTEEQMGRLFKTYEQANAGIALKYGGTGLGLAISQNIVNKMGGVIKVASKMGEGSEFSFVLSFDKTEAPVSENTQSHLLKTDFSKYRILLVEDVEINRFIVVELLSETKVKIEEAENGKIALDKFLASEKGYYDLIFMDVQMPVMDGYEATKEIRNSSHPDAKTIPIVAMTANAYKEDVDNAIAAGMNKHLAKPIDISATIKLMDEFLK